MVTQTFKLDTKKSRKPQRNNGPPPISNITYDLLWYIFTFLQFQHDDATNILGSRLDWHDKSRDHEISLTQIRRISQVCQYWRDMTLESPRFWAQAINLQLLNQKNDHWRKEVIKRTQQSPLSVRGTVSKASSPSTKLLLSLIRDDWMRIRVLNLVIDDRLVVQDPIWRALYHPAPNLEIFRIAVSPADFKIEGSGEGSNLFSDSAPRLRFLSCDTTPLTPSGSTQWASQLHTLIVSTFDLALPQILEALNVLPFLEILQIGWKAFRGKSWEVIGHDWPIAKPPSLRTLSLRNSYKHVGGFLQQLILPPTCQLFVGLANRPSDYRIPQTELRILRCSLTAHFSNVAGPKRLLWTSTSKILELAAENISIPEVTDPGFRVTILGCDDFNLDSLVGILPLAFSMCILASNITELDITLGQIDNNPSNASLLAFVRSLVSVEKLTADTESLELFVHLLDSNETPNLFPKLNTVALRSDRTCYLKPDAVMRFLMRRRDAGMAISVFDLRECRSPGQEQLLFLEGLDGLSVLWDPTIRKRIDEAYRDWTSVDSDD